VKYRFEVFVGVLLFAATAFGANPPQSADITVTAVNAGVFNFTINAASYAFGNVDANGTANSGGTQAIPGVRNGAPGTGATYTSTTAATWTLTSAPSRAVHIFNASSSGAPTSIAWGTADRLEIDIPTTGVAGATSCGFKFFATNNTDGGASPSCANGNLITGFTAGNGGNSVTGNLDFRLTVLDSDATGSNSWRVTLTAAAP
jgi:hypothetical protein